jgi:hypothetical protein
MDLRNWGRLVRRLELELKAQNWNEITAAVILCLQNMMNNSAYESTA